MRHYLGTFDGRPVYKVDPAELAQLVYNLDDIQYAEFFLVLYQMINALTDDIEPFENRDMIDFGKNITALTDNIRASLDEIINSDEIDAGAYWKNQEV